jgi:D-glycerate 3-kinase
MMMVPCMDRNDKLHSFLKEQRLPLSFLKTVDEWYMPLAGRIAKHHEAAGRTLLIGVNGSQGSGKSTLAALLTQLLAKEFGLQAIDLSIDDFYLTRQSRVSLARQIHPLLETRGVPGTHDVSLMCETLQQLTRENSDVSIPRFDKACDDRYPARQWHKVSAPFDVVIVEGWCLGSPAQAEAALHKPVNDLEAREDPDGHWRRYVNQQISGHYQDIYQMMDLWIMLRAPSFACVYQWRLEQEEKLAAKLLAGDQQNSSRNRVMTATQISRFIQHYQRLTEHSLDQLPGRVHFLFSLDAGRQIVAYDEPRAASF